MHLSEQNSRPMFFLQHATGLVGLSFEKPKRRRIHWGLPASAISEFFVFGLE